MKKILLSTFALLLAGIAHAQVGGTPRQLTCTEEAFNFKVNIKSGWHLSQVSMGPSGLPKGMPDYIPLRSFNEAVSGIDPILSENILMASRLQHVVNLRLPDSLLLPNPGNFQPDNLNYRFSYNNNLLHLINYSVKAGSPANLK